MKLNEFIVKTQAEKENQLKRNKNEAERVFELERQVEELARQKVL
jgi:hypothetical protein